MTGAQRSQVAAKAARARWKGHDIASQTYIQDKMDVQDTVATSKASPNKSQL